MFAGVIVGHGVGLLWALDKHKSFIIGAPGEPPFQVTTEAARCSAAMGKVNKSTLGIHTNCNKEQGILHDHASSLQAAPIED